VAQQLKATGHAAHGWLGVLIQPVTQDLARSFDLDEPSGALIARVEPNSPAAQAGLKAGDIVLEYNGKKLDTSGTLPPLVGATAVGEKVPLKILRQGKQQTLTVTIRALPGKQQLAAAEHTSGPAPLQILHLRVADLNAAQRRDLDIGKDGVLVQQVGNGPAAKAGIRPGDVLLQIDNRDVTSTEQLATLLPRLPHHKPLAVLLMRNRSPLFLAITIS
jgi:serine protease Do